MVGTYEAWLPSAGSSRAAWFSANHVLVISDQSRTNFLRSREIFLALSPSSEPEGSLRLLPVLIEWPVSVFG